jgi:hypothetical protein
MNQPGGCQYIWLDNRAKISCKFLAELYGLNIFLSQLLPPLALDLHYLRIYCIKLLSLGKGRPGCCAITEIARQTGDQVPAISPTDRTLINPVSVAKA